MGAGGVLGGAWLTGALHAIATETSWDPGSARYVVGTSSGAMVGAMIACGVPPWFMVAHSAGESFPGLRDANGKLAEHADRAGGASYRLHRGLPQLGPGSWRLAFASAARPHRFSSGARMAGWIPLGPISTEPLKQTVRRVATDTWAPHPNFWALAIDYTTGSRVALGRQGAPQAALPDAVAASCAVPGFFRAVEIAGRRYVDGGVHSISNVDVLEDEKLDMVVVLNPMSSARGGLPRSLGQSFAYPLRLQASRQLRAEVRRLERTGTEVLVIEPSAADLEAMGANLMGRGRRNDVIATATHTVKQHLHEPGVGERLAELPAGVPELLRRPAGGARDWPSFGELAEARWRQERGSRAPRAVRVPARRTA
jgi:NTE family protein